MRAVPIRYAHTAVFRTRFSLKTPLSVEPKDRLLLTAPIGYDFSDGGSCLGVELLTTMPRPICAGTAVSFLFQESVDSNRDGLVLFSFRVVTQYPRKTFAGQEGYFTVSHARPDSPDADAQSRKHHGA